MLCHLHNHTQYSLLDGMSTGAELAQRAKEIGQTAIALTDHGNLFGVIDFYNACKEEGIKPIIGCELYITENSNIKEKKELLSRGYGSYHLIFLAKNKTGYKNLINLVTRANLEGFYMKPRIDRKMLNKKNVSGLICLSACMQGEIAQAILAEDMEKADELCLYYKNLFGPDFYLEVQANRLTEQAIINEQIYLLGAKHDIKIVATTDSHYPSADDYRVHDVILAIGTKKVLTDPNRMMFTCNDFYVKTEEEMLEMLGRQDVIDNTMEVANKCNVELSFDDKFFPSFEVPEGYTPNEFFDKLCSEGLYTYLSKNKDLDKDKYLDRLRYELDIIDNKGYAEYFLIVNDFIGYCKKNGVSVGPGRGSAAGSLATFVLGITKLDPIKHDLMFERFLNPERMELPDIDIDFCYDNRNRVVDYVIDKYGQDKVANVATFGSLAARAALDGTGMALGVEFPVRKEMTKCVPDVPKITIGDALELSLELAEYKKQYPDLFDIAERIEGRKRHGSTHACGVCISPEKLTDITALRFKDGSSGPIVTHFDMDTLSSMGLLKFDFLGLKTITVIHNALEGLDIDIDAIPLDDPKVYAMLNSGNLLGVFQIEKSWAAKMVKQINPTNFDHITDIGALVRPGPLESGATKSYINRKSGTAPVEYVLSEIEDILAPTYGVLVYQEQIMKIVQRLASYTAGEADTFRKAIGKKIREKLMVAIEDFVARAVANGHERDIIEKLGEDMAKHARYSFNKAHAASYGFITYQTVWLKVYYPVRFMASLLSTEYSDPEKVIEYVREAQRLKINIVKPCVNRSTERFLPDEENNAIVYALSSIRDVGFEAAKMIAERGPYDSMQDFYNKVDRTKINKKTVLALISCGAMDCFGLSKPDLEVQYYECRNTDKFKDKDVVILNTDDNSLDMEYKYLGIYLSGSPFNTYVNDDLSVGGKEFYEVSGQITEARIFTTKTTNKKMAFIVVDTPSGFKKITVFPDVYAKHTNNVKNGKIITATVAMKNGDDLVATKIINAKKK
jgi:DNA polymerase III subunit alpha